MTKARFMTGIDIFNKSPEAVCMIAGPILSRQMLYIHFSHFCKGCNTRSDILVLQRA